MFHHINSNYKWIKSILQLIKNYSLANCVVIREMKYFGGCCCKKIIHITGYIPGLITGLIRLNPNTYINKIKSNNTETKEGKPLTGEKLLEIPFHVTTANCQHPVLYLKVYLYFLPFTHTINDSTQITEKLFGVMFPSCHVLDARH